MTKLTIEEFIAVSKELTLVELNEFVKAFEEEFGVTAATPVATVAVAPTTGGKAAAVEEGKDSSDVALKAAGNKKVAVIKEARALTSLSLREAKNLVDSAPEATLESVDREAANETKEQFKSASASVTVK